MATKKIENTTIIQTMTLLDTILKQNYLKFDSKYYQPKKGLAMGSPISALIAEIFLQHHEEQLMKDILDSTNIIFYNRYVDDILIIYNYNQINKDDITNYISQIHPDLKFTATDEIDNTINFLDLSITRKQHELDINIYRKPTTTDTTIHYKSNHPIQHKLAAYRFMLNRLHNLPLSKEHEQQELNTIIQIAQQNGYPTILINRLNNQIKNKINRPKEHTSTQNKNNNKKWTIFEYRNPLIRKVTNIFKNTNLRITFRISNTTQNLLKTHTQNKDKYKNSGIYSLRCNTCNSHYVGQTGRNLMARYTAHTRYIKNNEPKSAYALHILNNQHEYGPMQDTMNLIKSCKKGRHMNITENLYIQLFHREQLLIDEQYVMEINPLFQLIKLPPPTLASTQSSEPDTPP
jgi:hypothetical protein